MAERVPYVPSDQAWSMQASAQQIDTVCGWGKGVNLLTNWHFGPGVCNIRNQLSWTGAGMAVDGWTLMGNTYQKVELDTSKGCIRVTNVSTTSRLTLHLSQTMDWDKGNFDAIKNSKAPMVMSGLFKGNCRATILMGSGSTGNVMLDPDKFTLLSGRYAIKTNKIFKLQGVSMEPGTYFEVYAAKLEFGTEQTLAVRDASGDWVIADVPDPTIERLKSARYIQGFGGNDNMVFPARNYANVLRISLPWVGGYNGGSFSVINASTVSAILSDGSATITSAAMTSAASGSPVLVVNVPWTTSSIPTGFKGATFSARVYVVRNPPA